MKKFIMLAALIATSGSIAATTTSTTTTTTKTPTLSDKISSAYYGEITRANLANEAEENTKSTNMYHSVSLAYKIDDISKIKIALRAGIDNLNTITEEDESDRFSELDPRISYSRKLTKSLRLGADLELPLTQSSRDKGKQARIRTSLSYSKKMDNYNSLNIGTLYLKDIINNSIRNYDVTNNYTLIPNLTFTNTALSEKYTLQVYAEGSTSNKSEGGVLALEKLNLHTVDTGVAFDIAGNSIFTWARHNPNNTLAIDTLTAGASLYRSF